MKRIGLVVKPDEAVRQRADRFEAWLQARSIAVVRRDLASPDPEKTAKIIEELIEKNEIEKMKENIKKIRNPKVTYEIAEEILRLIP